MWQACVDLDVERVKLLLARGADVSRHRGGDEGLSEAARASAMRLGRTAEGEAICRLLRPGPEVRGILGFGFGLKCLGRPAPHSCHVVMSLTIFIMHWRATSWGLSR